MRDLLLESYIHMREQIGDPIVDPDRFTGDTSCFMWNAMVKAYKMGLEDGAGEEGGRYTNE